MTSEEKQNILDIIEFVIGHDPSVADLKDSFGEGTVSVVETILEELEKCNSSFRELLAGLVSGGRLRTKGWLRKSLGAVSKAIKRSNMSFYTCSLGIKIRYKSILLNSVG